MGKSHKPPPDDGGGRAGGLSPWCEDTLIARGGMGEAWKGRHRLLPLTVAIKRLKAEYAADPALRSRFHREVWITAKMGERTPHAVRVLDAGSDAKGLYMVMEHLQGETLQARLSRGRLSVRETCQVFLQMANGLRAAHAVHVVHRDLKPSNVFLAVRHPEAKVVVVLLDWGVSKALLPGGAPMPTVLAGTPCVMSREAVDGLPLDHRADVWSLSVVLYLLLSGRMPFEGRDELAVIKAVREGDRTPPSRVLERLGPEMNALFERAFAVDIDARHQSVDELVTAFLAALRHRRGSGRRNTGAARPRRPPPPPSAPLRARCERRSSASPLPT